MRETDSAGTRPGGRRVVLHVGMPKTGTTYLQSVLHASADELARQGVVMLPPSRREAFWLSLAVRDAVNQRRDPPAARSALTRFADDLAACEVPTAVVSDELIGGAVDDQVARLVAACGDREVHVLLTARRLSRLLPSTWQQRVKQGGETPDLEAFLDQVTAQEGRMAERWWEQRGLRQVVERWGRHVPAGRIHVVTMPETGDPRDLLVRAAEPLGLSAAGLGGASSSNPSLGHAQAEVLRRVRERIPGALVNRHDFVPLAKGWLSEQHLAPQDGTAPRMPARFRGWCEAEAADTARRLREAGVVGHGDLDDLQPTDADFADTTPSTAELLECALDALASISRERMADVAARRESADAEAAGAEGDAPSDRPGPGRRLVRRLRRLGS